MLFAYWFCDSWTFVNNVKFWANWTFLIGLTERPCFMARNNLPSHMMKPHNWLWCVEGCNVKKTLQVLGWYDHVHWSYINVDLNVEESITMATLYEETSQSSSKCLQGRQLRNIWSLGAIGSWTVEYKQYCVSWRAICRHCNSIWWNLRFGVELFRAGVIIILIRMNIENKAP